MSDHSIETLKELLTDESVAHRAEIYKDLAQAQAKAGLLPEAYESVDQGLELAETNSEVEADLFYNLSSYLFQEEKVEEALQTARKALNIYQKHETLSSSIIKTLRRLGVMHTYLEDDKGAAYFEQAKQLATEKKEDLQLGLCIVAEGDMYTIQKAYEKATMSYQKAIRIFKPIESHTHIGHCYKALGGILLMHDKKADAEETYEAAATHYAKKEHFEEQAECFKQIGRMYEQLSQPQQASKHFDRAAQAYHQANNDFDTADAYYQAGYVFEEVKSWEQAQQFYQKALPFAQEANDEMQLDTLQDSLEMVAEKLTNDKPKEKKSTGGGLFGKLKNIFGG